MKLWKHLDSLFVKTSLTLTFGLALFIMLATSFAWFFILSPLSNRAADDMAALVSLTSKTWVSLPVLEREAYGKKIALQHDLFFSRHDIPSQTLNKFYPFIPRLENALKRHTGQSIIIRRENVVYILYPNTPNQRLRSIATTKLIGYNTFGNKWVSKRPVLIHIG